MKNLFFRERRRLPIASEEQEHELGLIIAEARNAVIEEQKMMKSPEFRAAVEGTLKKIRGLNIEGITVPAGGDAADDAATDNDELNEEDDEEDNHEKFNLAEILGLDDEEYDLLLLLTGMRPPNEWDAPLDPDLMREFTALKVNRVYAFEAENKLVEGCIGLVISIANQYRSKGVPMLELIQEGYKGARRAARKFEVERNIKFATYASYWIRQRIRAVIINKGREIRFPQHVGETLYRINWAKNEVRHDPKRRSEDMPTAREIAEKLEVDEEYVEKYLSLPHADKVLDAPVKGDDNDADMHSVLPDRNMPRPDKQLDEKLKKHLVLMLLEVLNPNERRVIERRFGLNGYKDTETLEQVSEQKVTRERIRQIEEKAKAKMRRRMQTIMARYDLTTDVLI